MCSEQLQVCNRCQMLAGKDDIKKTKDFYIDEDLPGAPIVFRGRVLSKEDILGYLQGMDAQIGQLSDEYRSLADTEPGKYCCCGECN